MEFEQAFAIVNAAMYHCFGRYLKDIEVTILRGSWHNLTYEQIAESSQYSISYIRRHVGAKFWKLLSQALGEPVSKTNFRSALERRWQEEQQTQREQQNQPEPEKYTGLEEDSTAPIATFTHLSTVDWGEAIDVTIFYGREAELDTLHQWVIDDRCRLVALLGMGGIGKSSLAAKIAHLLQDQFEFVIWRSLRNAPPLETLLRDVVPFLSKQQDTQATPQRFLHWLRTHRCLVILDNGETMMQAGDRAGYYQPDYENYGDLFKRVGESAHQSCVILTSREKPAEVAVMEGMGGCVRSFQLSGSRETSLALLEAKGLQGTEAEKLRLCEQYSYSPLALKIVASSINNLFDGEIADFLEQDTLIFNGLRHLLEQQFERLSYLEQTIMYWLAINREWISVDELLEDIIPTVSRASVLESLESLCWRSLIERQSRRYTQQPAVMEYVTSRLIDQVITELITTRLKFFHQFALIKNTVQDYIRESQVRVLLLPILNQLLDTFHRPEYLEQQLQKNLDLLRCETEYPSGYGAGNLINLLRQQKIDLTRYDFSHLTLRHAHLQKLNLHHVNFAHAKFINPVFTHTLTSIFAVALSPEGTLLATGESTGEIHLWRIDDAQPLLVFKGHVNRVLAVGFSPDGRWLASASADSMVKLWEVASGRLIATLKGHSNGVCSVSFSADQTLLASASMDYTVMVWEMQTYQPVQTLKAHTNWAWAVCFSPLPDRKLLASGSADATIKLWDAASGELLKTLEGHSDRIWSVRFSPNGRLLVSASEDLTVRLWDVETGKLLKTLEGHDSIVWSASFSANGKMVASGSSDQTVRVWDVATGQLLKTLTGHTNRVWSVRFSPVEASLPSGNVHVLVSGSADCTANLWDAESGRLIRTIQGYTNGVRSIDFSTNGSILASGTAADHVIKLWDVTSGRLLRTLHHHTDSIHSIKCFMSETGDEMLASGGSDRVVNLWDIQTGTLVRTLHGHSDTIWAVSVNPQGSVCASAGADYTIRLWDVASGQLLTTLQEHEGWIWAVCFSPDGKQIASGSGDSTVKIWDVASGQILNTLEGHTAWVRSVVFSPDGTKIASGSADCTVKLWDVMSGQLFNTLHSHTSWTWAVSFNLDGTQLASSSTDRTVKLWDVPSGRLLNTLEGHTSEVWSVRFNPQGNLLVSSSADETVRFWDAGTGKCLKTLRADRPYEGMNITGVKGLTDAQKATLRALGAIESH
ncbi:hypothetical protein C7B76_18765 [filamentous cyanobacterium CCP2]|nr:hypothetical protein C7B76_18765 [filamentous cyanobacterium CCP2]